MIDLLIYIGLRIVLSLLILPTILIVMTPPIWIGALFVKRPYFEVIVDGYRNVTDWWAQLC